MWYRYCICFNFDYIHVFIYLLKHYLKTYMYIYIYIYTHVCVSSILLQYVRVLLLLRQSESKAKSHVSGLLQQIRISHSEWVGPEEKPGWYNRKRDKKAGSPMHLWNIGWWTYPEFGWYSTDWLIAWPRCVTTKITQQLPVLLVLK